MLPKHYRQLSDASVSTINDVKDLEQRLLDSIVGDSTEAEQARINIRQGVMWAVLNITKSEPTKQVRFLPRVRDDNSAPTLTEAWGPSLVTWSEIPVENPTIDFLAISDQPDLLHAIVAPEGFALISINGEHFDGPERSTTEFGPDGVARLTTDKLMVLFNYRTGTMEITHAPEVKSFGVCFYARVAQ